MAGELPVAWFMLGQKQGYMAVGSMVCESSGTDSQQEGELGGGGRGGRNKILYVLWHCSCP